MEDWQEEELLEALEESKARPKEAKPENEMKVEG